MAELAELRPQLAPELREEFGAVRSQPPATDDRSDNLTLLNGRSLSRCTERTAT